MSSCLNCYNSWICKTKTPDKYNEHLENDSVCINWEDDSVNYDD